MNIGQVFKMVAVAARVKEPSSWAGAAAIIQGAGVLFPQWAGILTGVAALLGAVAVKIPERGAQVPQVPDSGPLAQVVGPQNGGP